MIRKELVDQRQAPKSIAFAMKDGRMNLFNSVYISSGGADILMYVTMGLLFGLGFAYPPAWFALGAIVTVLGGVWLLQKRGKGQ